MEAPATLNATNTCIFFQRPKEICIDEELVTRYSTSQKIETLIADLKEKGPLIGLGKIGPNCYNEPCFKLKHKFEGQDIYGWKPGLERKDRPASSYVIVLGAQKIENRAFVYFTLSLDITPDTKTYFRKYVPSPIDTKIYVVSHKKFGDYLTDLYAPGVNLEKKYLDQLISIEPLDSILDRGEVEKRCKAIGQAIFDEYKSRARGDSLAGRDGVAKICDSLRNACLDGLLRKQYVEKAWAGIGDDNWFWMP